MNAVPLPPLPGASSSPNEIKEPPVRLARLLTSLFLAVAAFDLCYWKIQVFGFSTAVFFPAVAALVLMNRRLPNRAARWLLVLMAGAAVGSALEADTSNTLVLFGLMIALAGETYFTGVESTWGRWLSQFVAWLRAPGRIFWLVGLVLRAIFSDGLGWLGRLVCGCFIVLPALVLTLIFGMLLASGNAVFGTWTDSFFEMLWRQFELYFDFWRVALWLFIALLVLPLLRPVQVSARWWSGLVQLPRLPEIVPIQAATWSSALILIVLNLLFFVANLADVLFLWSKATLPTGVTYSHFVHEGVNALITTALLSALVLTAIFQQALPISRRRELKMLAYAWTGQNLFLMLSIGLRLKRYIEAYDMSVERLGVMIFLVVVAVGYASLTVKIWKEKSLSWLVGGCVLAVFATFYITQFLDLAGWSANFNVTRWEKDRTRKLDVSYIGSMGPAGWPDLRRAHEMAPDDASVTEAWETAHKGIDYADRCGLDWTHWREFSLRGWMNRGALEEPK